MINSLLNWFKSLSPLIKWVIAIALAVLLLFVFIKGKDSIGNWWEKRQEAAYDKKMAKKEAEVAKLAAERDKAIVEAKEAIAKAELKEQESDLLKLELAKYGKAAQDAVKKQDEAVKNYEDEKNSINADASAFARCTSLCGERAKLGYPCPQRYCDKYAGR